MKKNRTWIRRMGFALVLVLLGAALFGCGKDVSLYREKMELLKAQALSPALVRELGSNPAGSAGHAVFLSVSDTASRASVYTGTGQTLEEAWEAADRQAAKALGKTGLEPVWLKADVVYLSQQVSAEELSQAVLASRQDFLRYGVAFDENFDTALQEAEMNGNKIYEYEKGGIDLSYLNSYLKKAGREQLKQLPESYTVFQCIGWLCDEDKNVHALDSSGLDYGRRSVEVLDRDYAAWLISNAGQFLVDQVQEDGSFVYGMYPRFDNEIENYNIVRHASTLWSLVCRYRMEPSEELEQVIDRAFGYMLTQMVYDGEDTAYLYESKDDEIKLGGSGVAVVAMTEYMDVFGNDRYLELCRKLGNGILNMMDVTTGEYYHVLNGDLTRKEAFRTVYYDGEATFALCRLYSLTGEQQWLDAAVSAVDRFIREDYTQHKDHWVAYSLNEITRHVPRDEYYAFALENVQVNLEEIRTRDTTYHTYLELLMASFELYDCLVQNGAKIQGFDEELFLKTIYTRADRQLNGYFYPEYAMYMENPQRVVDTFMVRHDGCRIRIDDVQHNIGGYYLYYKNYDRLVERGMLEAAA